MERFFIALAFFAFVTDTATASDKSLLTAPPLLTSSSADDSTQGVLVEPKAVPATPNTNQNRSQAVGSSRTNSKEQSIWIGPGIIIYDGNYGNILGKGNVALSMNISWLTLASATVPLYVGVDGGLDFWNDQFNEQSISGTGIQVLPTALYRFTVSSAPQIYPFFGISFGPHIYVGQSRTGSSTTAAFYELLVRPGVQWQLNPIFALSFEPKLGVLNSDFVSIIQLTANLAL